MKRILLGLIVFFLAVQLLITLWALFGPAVRLPMPTAVERGQTLVLMLFSLGHAVYLLGWRPALIFFTLSAGVSWFFEQLGVATGAVYGAYHYSDMLGPKLGHVPLAIPLAWFMMMYPAYVIANLIAEGQPVSHRRGFWRVVWLAILSAMVITAWDLAMDPILSGVGLWVWEESGPYFGVPIQNFAGWMLTTFTIYLCYRLWERRTRLHPLGPVTGWIIWMPLLAYGSQIVRVLNRPVMGLIAGFAMGLPLLAAAGRVPAGTAK